MDDLISRAAAISWFFRPYSNEEYYSNLDVVRALKAIPTVDAVPVMHGRWIRYSEIFHDPEYTLVKCSVCGGESCCDAAYCPDCGAKMDGET